MWNLQRSPLVQLTRVCAVLPLALQITAALLVADPAGSAAELATGMADEVRGLEVLPYDDGGGASAPVGGGRVRAVLTVTVSGTRSQ